jgi:hypothetical protein
MLALGILIWGLNMRRGLNHDEHQFIAGAALLAREGLLPYADFPYFHLPLLSLIDAALFRFSPQLLLTARAFSMLSAWLTLGLLLMTGYRLLAPVKPWSGLGLGAAGAVLLVFTPLFVYTSGRAWNHDLPILLTLLAAGLLLGDMSHPSDRRISWTALGAGVLLGLAIIARASFALLIPAFLVGYWLSAPQEHARRSQTIGWFGLGGILGALPALWLLARGPEGFFFGNLTYVRLNTQYYLAQAADYPGMSVGAKLRVGGDLLLRQPANALPLLTFVAMAAWAWRACTATQRRALLVLALLILSAFLSALAATPAQTQYFYAPLPLAVFGTLHAVSFLATERRARGIAAMGGAAILALALTARLYGPGLAIVAQPDEWYPRKVHARGELIAGLTGGRGPVLTLAPTHVLEGGGAIYPAFATGPFAWRVADLVAPDERAALGLMGPTDFTEHLAIPPRALLTSLDNDDEAEEAPLIAYAQANGYLPVDLPDEGTLWLSPLADWGGLIRLGGMQLADGALDPGDERLVTLYLQAMASMDRDLNLLVRLIGGDGRELWRADGWPYGAPTSVWPVGEVRPDGYTITIPDDAASGLYKLEASLYDPATLEPVGAPITAGVIRVGAEPSVGPPVATLGNGITLHDPTVVAGAGALDIRLIWQTAAPLPAGLVRFVQALDGSGRVAAQQDGPVMNGFLPAQAWPVESPIADRITLDVPPGEYSVITGFYDPETGQRLPVQIDGRAAGDHVVITNNIATLQNP